MKPAPPVTTTFTTSVPRGRRSRPVAPDAVRPSAARPYRSPGPRWPPCTVRRCLALGAAIPDVSRIYLSPPDVGPAERERCSRRSTAAGSRRSAPTSTRSSARSRRSPAPGHARRPVERHRRAAPRAAGCSGSARATRCSCRRSRSSPPPTRSSTSAPRPIFVDCDADTWNIDPGLVAEELDERAPAGPAARRGDRASTSTASAPTATRSPTSCARARRRR